LNLKSFDSNQSILLSILRFWIWLGARVDARAVLPDLLLSSRYTFLASNTALLFLKRYLPLYENQLSIDNHKSP